MQFITNIKSKILLGSKFLRIFDERRIRSITHVIYSNITIQNHVELIGFLFIIDIEFHSIILNKS